MSLTFGRYPSPVGTLVLVARDDRLAAILWENDDPSRVVLGEMREDAATPVLVRTRAQLDEYFAGERRTFSLDLDFAGTPFQQSVWNALLAVPYGETRTYGDLAQQLGDLRKTRAVGAANGRNPISIVVPCHRVIGASGKLVGFAGGIDVKARLLQLEATHAPYSLFSSASEKS